MSAIMDIREIMEILPHRYPFLLVDRVLEIEDRKRIVAIKNVTMNEPFFQGHFPGVPVMPGVLQCEAMAQAAGIMMLNRLRGTGKLAYLMSMNNVKFRKPVVPGDQLIITAESIRDRGAIGTVSAKVEVDGKVVSEAEITFSIADRT
jgi:beta-hydroxyacyl-ACP dehydratase FabZ